LNILLSKRYRDQSKQLKYIQGQLFDEAELEKASAKTQEQGKRTIYQLPPMEKGDRYLN
jgi:hypothetical protein